MVFEMTTGTDKFNYYENVRYIGEFCLKRKTREIIALKI